ncbi:hypothetical protein DCAR_0522413 [Daucus carota subsp. sativus]|uniref:Lunapark zinc ribbon domain-containing protein n=1 Tax=Daucus carota subsp. sativus TaxID=79200 RepID=A0A162A540_DAUCS|nr:PREDICTED: uncharacterized protein At2g24330-like [Daucus carota subsp. sativus]WOH03022.1 hypothetical protein DCAR_0522413 [Daucus carota subsp. sativus]
MASESEREIAEIVGALSSSPTSPRQKKKKTKRGVFSRMWNGLFGIHGDDFEKRLKHISKEEATVLARLKKRSTSWRRMTRNLVVFSVLFEVIAVGYAIITTRSLDLNWKMRALRVLPMFLLPAVSSLTYSALVSITRMCDRKDQETIERLRAERIEKINELKERTNYYTTQQLIQRYDPDPAAKAAAATVLASKLGMDSGLKLYMGDDSKFNHSMGKSTDAEHVQSSGLRNRKQPLTRSNSNASTGMQQLEAEMMQHAAEGSDLFRHEELVVEHETPTGIHAQDGGWIARLAALLVGEDPTQSYALICGSCHMHNGLARREDFPYITYYCPHCNALNRPKQLEDNSPNSSQMTSPGSRSFRPVDDSLVQNVSKPVSGKASDSSSPVAATVEQKETQDVSRPFSDKVYDGSSHVAAAVEPNETQDVGRAVTGKASDSSSPVAAAMEHKETQDVSRPMSEKASDGTSPVAAAVEHRELQDVGTFMSDKASDSSNSVAAELEHKEIQDVSKPRNDKASDSNSPTASEVEHKETSETTAHESEVS